jgi:hypothetical protein
MDARAAAAEQEVARCAAELTALLQGRVGTPSPALAKLRAVNKALQSHIDDITATTLAHQGPRRPTRLAEDADDAVEGESDVEPEDLNLHVAVCRFRRRGAIKRKVSAPKAGVRTLKSIASARVKASLTTASDNQREWISAQLPPNIRTEIGWIVNERVALGAVRDADSHGADSHPNARAVPASDAPPAKESASPAARPQHPQPLMPIQTRRRSTSGGSSLPLYIHVDRGDLPDDSAPFSAPVGGARPYRERAWSISDSAAAITQAVQVRLSPATRRHAEATKSTPPMGGAYRERTWSLSDSAAAIAQAVQEQLSPTSQQHAEAPEPVPPIPDPCSQPRSLSPNVMTSPRETASEIRVGALSEEENGYALLISGGKLLLGALALTAFTVGFLRKPR